MHAFKKPGRTAPRRIVIFRALQLGDLLNAVPAFRALRAAFPHAHITLVGLPWSAELVRRFDAYLDSFISFPGFPGLPEQTPDLPRLLSFLEEVQAMNFDLAIQMQGSGEIANPLIGLFGAKQTAGYFLPGQYCPDPEWFMEYPEGEAEAWRHLRLMEFLGIPLQGAELEFPLLDEDWEALERLRREYGLGKEYICIHPGARARERRWPPQHFAAVADRLAARGCQIVLTGMQQEADLTAAVAARMKAPAVDLAGQTDLGALAALVSRARLVFSNDTGISHVAAAVKTPSVVLFPVPESIRWAPLNEKLHRRIWDAMGLPPEQVLPQVEAQLEGGNECRPVLSSLGEAN